MGVYGEFDVIVRDFFFFFYTFLSVGIGGDSVNIFGGRAIAFFHPK